MPEAAQSVILEMGARLWAVLSAEFATSLEAVRREFATARQELEQELVDTLEAVSMLEAENADLSGQLLKAGDEGQSFETRLRDLSEVNGRAEARAEAMEVAIARLEAEVSSQRNRGEFQEGELARLRQENMELREARAGADAIRAALEARRHELEGRQQVMEERTARAERRADEAEVRADGLRNQLETFTASFSALRDQHATKEGRHQEELAKMTSDLAKMKEHALAWKAKAERLGASSMAVKQASGESVARA